MEKQADCDVTVTCVTYETLFVEGNMMKSSKIFAGCENYLSQLETIRNVFNFVADYTLFELVTRFEIVIQAKEQTEKFSQKSVINGLPNEFDRASFVSACSKTGYKTPPRLILHRLIKAGLVVKTQADRYRKVAIS